MKSNKSEEFTSLNLDRTLIEVSINEAIANTGMTISKAEKAGQILYRFSLAGQNDALLNIYYNKNGSTTIQYKTGKNQELSLSVAEKIVEKSSVKSYEFGSFHIKNIRQQDFDTVLEFLQSTYEAKIIETREISHGTQYKVQSRQGDILSFNNFSNGSLQVQGKPLLLFSETIEILTELLPFGEVIDQQLKFYSTNLTAKTIIGELENRMPTSIKYIDEKIIAIICPALALRKYDAQLTDYSVFVFPVFRGLEGIIKQIFRDKNILISKDHTFGDYFSEGARGIGIREEYKLIINCTKTCNALIRLYTHFKKYRHELFHVEGTVTPTRIINRPEANKLIEETLNLIEEVYVSLN